MFQILYIIQMRKIKIVISLILSNIICYESEKNENCEIFNISWMETFFNCDVSKTIYMHYETANLKL